MQIEIFYAFQFKSSNRKNEPETEKNVKTLFSASLNLDLARIRVHTFHPSKECFRMQSERDEFPKKV